MTLKEIPVYLNSFSIKTLSDIETKVYCYQCDFKKSPQSTEIAWRLNQIAYKTGIPAIKFQNKILCYDLIDPDKIETNNYVLRCEANQYNLDLNKQAEHDALERLQRKYLYYQLKQIDKYQVSYASDGGFIWWNRDKVEVEGKDGKWELHSGVKVDIFLSSSGKLYLEIDQHNKLNSPWTLTKWLKAVPEIADQSLTLRNTYDSTTWKFVAIDNSQPNEAIIEGLGQTVASYHLNLAKSPATKLEVESSQVIWVNQKNKDPILHLSSRVKPSISLDILSLLAQQGDKQAEYVFKRIKPNINQRLEKAKNVAQVLAHKVYGIEKQNCLQISSYTMSGKTIQYDQNVLLCYQNKQIKKVFQSLNQGCYVVGEKKFGCLDLVGNHGWGNLFLNKLNSLLRKHQIQNIHPNAFRKLESLPSDFLGKSKFWQSWRDEGIQTVLVVTHWLKNKQKRELIKEALEAGIALQFMSPVNSNHARSEEYRLNNVLSGLLVKAGWQTVGLKLLNNELAADLAIGFDAGRNEHLSYGTSSFAVLANGQILGWELPEAQKGEIIDPHHVRRSVRRIIDQYCRKIGQQPQRILLMRDGLIQAREFNSILEALDDGGIKYDLLSVRKSGAGRIAKKRNDNYCDVDPGTFVVLNQNEFKIITSEAKAGGSARPLFIVREKGDTPIDLIAEQIYRLTLLHPASSSFTSRLPMPLHYADKLAKKVQDLGEVGILQNLPRQKLFFV